MGRRIMFCIEAHFQDYREGYLWSLRHLLADGDDVHLVVLLPPSAYFATSAEPALRRRPGSPSRDAGGEQPASAVDILKRCVEDVKSLGLQLKGWKTHAFASGSLFTNSGGSSLVEYAESRNVDLVVLGRKGLTPRVWRFTRMTCTTCFVSHASDHCLHEMHCPVLVISPDTSRSERTAAKLEDGKRSNKNICLACDALEHSKDMVKWAAKMLITEGDSVTVISVSMVASSGGVDSNGMQSRSTEQSVAEANAHDIAEAAAISLEDILYQHGEESDARGVAQALCHYAELCDCDVLVVGNRGLGPCARALDDCCGRGSIGDFCTHFATCPVLVYKH